MNVAVCAIQSFFKDAFEREHDLIIQAINMRTNAIKTLQKASKNDDGD